MLSLYNLGCVAATILAIGHTAIGSPTPQQLTPRDAALNLIARDITEYVDCTDDQKSKLGQGFADAATLARWVFDHPIDKNGPAYVAFTHDQESHADKSCAVSPTTFDQRMQT